VWDDSDPTVVLYDTGRRSSTASAFTLPKGVITSESATYRLRVRVWDILSRANTPGDTAHTEQITTFVYNDGATVPVTGLTAKAQANGLPHVQLNWTSATAPDSFAVSRNGKFIADLDPADVLVSGTAYQYIDKSATPGQDITYRVRRRSSNVLSGGSTVTINYLVREIWLAEFDDISSNRLVPVQFNLADCTFSMPEVSGAYQPVDGDAPVIVIQGQQGLAGTIVGRIIGVGSISAANAVGDMLWFKQHPDTQLRMTMGNQNLRVVISAVTLSPLGTGKVDQREVSFNFASLDGPTQ
jgi:hypothetical protein